MFDFHIHSIYSDGTYTISDLHEALSRYSMFAITDHDNVEGCKEYLNLYKMTIAS